MILHKNRLPADDSHEISCLICYFLKSGKIFNCRLQQIIGGALSVNYAIYYKKLIKTAQGAHTPFWEWDRDPWNWEN